MGTNLKPSQTSKASNALRLVLLSDTHQHHREIDVPDGDILIHAGDFTFFSKSLKAILDFNHWLGELPHRCVAVPGNHEFFLEADPSRRSLIDNASILINEGIVIQGLRIWGSPVTPLYGGAFGLSSAEDRRRLYARIPENTDVLVTHGPPYGILDSSPSSGMHSGCRELFDAVMRVRPRLHVFGHVHDAYGIFVTNHTTFVNACLHGVDFGLDRSPHVFRLTKR
jgi:Icc-related predicted phosphoesterase